jgi:amino acid permease
MSESPVKEEVPVAEKEAPYAPPAYGHDVETGDAGILVKSEPLARKLKGRHMQMIAIGNLA